jgi:hypothetical protein
MKARLVSLDGLTKDVEVDRGNMVYHLATHLPKDTIRAIDDATNMTVRTRTYKYARTITEEAKAPVRSERRMSFDCTEETIIYQLYNQDIMIFEEVAEDFRDFELPIPTLNELRKKKPSEIGNTIDLLDF